MDFGLLSLFFGSFLASTVVPGGVEGLLYLMVQQGYQFSPLLITATVGNTLGGVVTWWMGTLLQRGLKNTRIAKWFTLAPKAVARVRKFGPAALLLSWMPVIGDPLCVAAGYLSLRFWPCFIAIFIGKVMRYLILLYWLFS